MRLAFMLLLVARICLAQTNAPITFTNEYGVVSNAEPVKVEHNKLIYRLPNGGGGTVKLKELPPLLQNRFGYDPENEAAEEIVQRQHAEEAERMREQAALEAISFEVAPKTNGIISFKSHPLRWCQGRKYDFSEAIKWFADAPPTTCPYPTGSTMAMDWQSRIQKHEAEGQKWKQFMLDGSGVETRPEGIVVNVPVIITVEDWVRRGSVIVPRYTPKASTKQVLLKNMPGNSMQLPIFAIPIGQKLVGSVVVEAFDYGTPLASNPVKTHQNLGLYKDGVPPNVYQSIADEATRKWPNNYRMQEYEVERQVEAYKKLHPL